MRYSLYQLCSVLVTDSNTFTNFSLFAVTFVLSNFKIDDMRSCLVDRVGFVHILDFVEEGQTTAVAIL